MRAGLRVSRVRQRPAQRCTAAPSGHAPRTPHRLHGSPSHSFFTWNSNWIPTEDFRHNKEVGSCCIAHCAAWGGRRRAGGRLHHIHGWETRTYTADMIPDKAPKEDVFHSSEELKKEAHISSFEQYKEMYLRSIESPDGQEFPFLTLRRAHTHHTSLLISRIHNPSLLKTSVFSSLFSGSQWFWQRNYVNVDDNYDKDPISPLQDYLVIGGWSHIVASIRAELGPPASRMDVGWTDMVWKSVVLTWKTHRWPWTMIQCWLLGRERWDAWADQSELVDRG